MPKPRNPVSRLFWFILLWLPVLFAAWYYMGAVQVWPLAQLTDLLFTAHLPQLVSAVEQQGTHLNVVLTLIPELSPGSSTPAGRVAELIFTINPLIYGYGLPLYSALVMAVPGSEWRKWLRWGSGVVILLTAQLFSVSMEILKSLLFDLGPEAARQLMLAPWQQELTALGYQFGYLILPAVLPIVLWIVQHRRYLATLVPALDQGTPEQRS